MADNESVAQTYTPPQAKPASGVAELTEAVNKLKALLDDPQQGMSSWLQMVSGRCLEIADFAGYGKLSELAKQKSDPEELHKIADEALMLLGTLSQTMIKWVHNTRQGGFSTHLVDPMRTTSSDIQEQMYALRLRLDKAFPQQKGDDASQR